VSDLVRDMDLGLEEISADIVLVFNDLETDVVKGDIEEGEESDAVSNNSDVLELDIDAEEFDT
jgi:hypothetical protein